MVSQYSSDEFNDHFTSQIDTNSAPLMLANSMSITNTNSFEFTSVREIEVLKAITSVKSKATGIDRIPMKFINIILPLISSGITHISNFCIEKNCFPDPWKISLVIPLPKISAPKLINDFRPISVLPIFAKAFEIILNNQLSSCINNSKFLDPLQSGFRCGHSTASALSLISHDISKALDTNKFINLVLLDFSRAGS